MNIFQKTHFVLKSSCWPNRYDISYAGLKLHLSFSSDYFYSVSSSISNYNSQSGVLLMDGGQGFEFSRK